MFWTRIPQLEKQIEFLQKQLVSERERNDRLTECLVNRSSGQNVDLMLSSFTLPAAEPSSGWFDMKRPAPVVVAPQSQSSDNKESNNER